MIERDLLITIVSTIVLGVLAQVIAERARIPSIIFLLGMGLVCGPDGLGLVRPALFGEGLYIFTALAVAIILFEGGLTLEIASVRHVSRSVLNLITIGALTTWAGGAIVSWLVLDIPWSVAILFGSLVIVTGPTVIAPILRTVKVTKGIRTILKWEGILIDAVGAIIAVLVLGFVLSEESTLLGTMTGFTGRIVVGCLAGVGGGLLLSMVLRVHLSETIRTLVVFAGVFLMFGVSELIIRESGIMSVTVAGITMGNLKGPNLQHIKGFKEKLTILLVSILFVVLAANLRVSELESLGWRGVVIVLGLMLIVRPLNIWASVREKTLSLREKLFLSWIAPRGIIAAAVASLFSLTLLREGFEGASLLTSLTFFTIGITVFVQGATAGMVARALGVLQTGSSGLLILGGNEFGLKFAKELGHHGIPVAILDSNHQNCMEAERIGLTSYHGDVLDDEVWDRMDLTSIGGFLAATVNNELNSLACLKATELFGHDHVFQMRHSHSEEKHPFGLERIRGNQQYDLAIDIVTLSGKMRSGHARIESVPASAYQDNSSNSSIVLCGIGKDGVSLTTDPVRLAAAERVVRITLS